MTCSMRSAQSLKTSMADNLFLLLSYPVAPTSTIGEKPVQTGKSKSTNRKELADLESLQG